MKEKTIKVKNLARVEGEGALYVKIKGDAVKEVRLEIFEPPRFFEALLRGRTFGEAPDITARICGICPVAYQMSAVHAMENAFGVEVDGPLRALRRLIYCGEWIESHALHVYLLHAPDFLGYPDALRMGRDHPEILERGLRLKQTGNEILRLLGGREVHPVNVCVGGFYKVPTRRELAPLAERLRWSREAALETVRWTAALPCPEFEQDYEFVGLRHPLEYPFNEGRLVSNRGLDIAVHEYEDRFVEEQVPHSHALHSRLKNRGAYLVGPIARYSLNFDRLSPVAREAARAAGLSAVCRNPFRSIVVRSIEILQACDEALRIIEGYERPDRPAVPIRPRAGTGYGCTEAPRGALYHRYRVDDAGVIEEAKIVPPTSQNQTMIEDDLRRFIQAHVNLPKEELGLRCEQTIRNYDPCISCATHFLRMTYERD
ncbi:MAG TPA: Ni/Fe hydrogenase subunit alpha [Nitrospiria bacterium]|jgi:coenzyme F420-reducing hydrogenase alpha subunit|nr:Ni/Fe hydrogenase subunit alpha [Nitrospiria bacterium]